MIISQKLEAYHTKIYIHFSEYSKSSSKRTTTLRTRRYHTADSPPEVLVAVIRPWVDVCVGEGQVVSVVGRVGCRRPTAAGRATTTKRGAIHVAGMDKVVRPSTNKSIYWTSFFSSSVIRIVTTSIASWDYAAI